MTYIKVENTSIRSQRRKRNKKNKGDDIEDPYIIGNIKQDEAWPWWCKKCGAKLVPYKEDEYGDIVMTCTNQNCWLHKMHKNSINVKLAKMLKQQQMNSRLYYRTYKGGYY